MVMVIIVSVYVLLSLVYWVWMAYGSVRVVGAVPLLAKLNPVEPEHWPSVSVIVPARNEADKLGPAVQTLLEEDYQRLEIVLVNDRSSDATGEIIERAAEQDERVTAVHISELPQGWMGKVHALDTGLAASSCEFVLFTDADAHFKRGTLGKAVGYCLEKKLDHLAGFPELWRTNIVLESVIWVFIRGFLMLLSRPWAACKPGARAYMGIGAFNLVRRAAFEATEGFEWLRREVADDMGVGLLMKRSGARCGSMAAFGYVGLEWYGSLGEAARGAEKGFATVSQFSLVRTLAIGAVMLGMEIAPVLTMVPLFFDKVRIIGYLGVVVFGAFVFSVVVLGRWGKGRILPGLFGPLAVWLLVWMFVRAGIVGWRRGGVAWRGTLYGADELRGGGRVHFP